MNTSLNRLTREWIAAERIIDSEKNRELIASDTSKISLIPKEKRELSVIKRDLKYFLDPLFKDDPKGDRFSLEQIQKIQSFYESITNIQKRINAGDAIHRARVQTFEDAFHPLATRLMFMNFEADLDLLPPVALPPLKKFKCD